MNIFSTSNRMGAVVSATGLCVATVGLSENGGSTSPRRRPRAGREYGRKLSGGRAFSLITCLPLKVCNSIVKASLVRILHLPPRAERAPDAM